MSLRDKLFVAVVILACLVGFYRLGGEPELYPPVKPESSILSFDESLPDFAEFDNVDDKKQAFFDFLLPLVQQENQRLQLLRDALQQIASQEQELNKTQLEWVLKLAEYYHVIASDTSTDNLDIRWVIDELLLRVDQVPPSLALAQAANESAWGTSRFATEGNNLYGQWCFKKGCGLVPGDRPDGTKHEVASFSSPAQSVRRYIHNLNTHLAYKHFRQLRAEHRKAEQPLSGKKSAETLARYSTRGAEYIQELKAMIRINKLSRFDDA